MDLHERQQASEEGLLLVIEVQLELEEEIDIHYIYALNKKLIEAIRKLKCRIKHHEEEG